MLKLRYKDDLLTSYEVEFSRITSNVISLAGDFPSRKCGFILSRTDQEDGWDYGDYTTIYKYEDATTFFSNDGSVFQPATTVEQTPLSDEEIKAIEMAKKNNAVRQQIDTYKRQIQDTDYQIIKTYEYFLVNKETSYNITDLHNQRQALRDKINELESSVSENVS